MPQQRSRSTRALRRRARAPSPSASRSGRPHRDTGNGGRFAPSRRRRIFEEISDTIRDKLVTEN